MGSKIAKRPVTQSGPPCVVAGCERPPAAGTLICSVHAQALRPTPPAGDAA